MSFRIEEKVVCTAWELSNLQASLKARGMRRLFPRRKVESLYFDNAVNGMFADSEEGSLPRKKIRVRHYDDDLGNKSLEIKVSSVEGRFKTTEPISSDRFCGISSKGLVDRMYGVCRPKLTVSYARDYFSFQGIRITFDTGIRYRKFNSSWEKTDYLNVVELKAPHGAPPDFLRLLLDAPRRRFSKFSRGIEAFGIRM